MLSEKCSSDVLILQIVARHAANILPDAQLHGIAFTVVITTITKNLFFFEPRSREWEMHVRKARSFSVHLFIAVPRLY